MEFPIRTRRTSRCSVTMCLRWAVAHHTSADSEPITSSRIRHIDGATYYSICPSVQSTQFPKQKKTRRKSAERPAGQQSSPAHAYVLLRYHGVIFRGSRNFIFPTKQLTVGVWCCGRLSPLCALSCHHFLLTTAVSRRTDQRAQTTSQGQHQRQTRKCVN